MSELAYKKIEQRELRRLYVKLRKMGYEQETTRTIGLLKFYGELND